MSWSARRDSPPRVRRNRLNTISVVVLCHNYGCYLKDALESVFSQSVKPDQILVIDDSSTDNTRAIATSLGARIEYHYAQYSHPLKARLFGYRKVTSDVICFLDADDFLPHDYLEGGLREFVDDSCGIVYSDIQTFGVTQKQTTFPDKFCPDQLARNNLMHSGSLVRTQAIQSIDPIRDDIHPTDALHDWYLWRAIIQSGWGARKQSSPYLYRKHNESLSKKRSAAVLYFAKASLSHEIMTLYVPLSGRTWAWERFAGFLNLQTWPVDQLCLHLIDTSEHCSFSETIRKWLGHSRFPHIRYEQIPLAEGGLADLPRKSVIEEVRSAMSKIYSHMVRALNTDYVWILEDDILPPLDACESLLKCFDSETVSVSGVYRSRSANGFVAWDMLERRIVSPRSGVQLVGGNGFGCVVVRREVLRNEVFATDKEHPDFDHAFYARVKESGLTSKLNWHVNCTHMEKETMDK